MKYKDYNDYELISYIEESNEEANDILFEKYKPFIIATAKKMYSGCRNSGLDINDFIQEGFLGLNLAIKHFDEEKGALFYTFAKTIIERRMISLIVSTKRLKHKFLNDSISLDINTSDGGSVSIEEFIGSDEGDPELLLINDEKEKELIKSVVTELTPFEEQVFMLRINNFDYKEIASILGKNSKSIDNALQRIKNKSKTIFEKVN